MKARKYINRISVWGVPEVTDGFGGDTYGEPIQLAQSWCNIRTLTPERLTDLGLMNFKYGVEINLRKRNDLNYYDPDIYFIYNDVNYMIQSIVKIDLKGYEIKIIATSK